MRRRVIAQALGRMTFRGLTVIAGLSILLGGGALLLPLSSGPCRGYAQRRTVAEAQIRSIAAALNDHVRTFGDLPQTSEGLERVLGRAPIDPWGTPYAYSTNGQQYRILSLGADRRIGGEGEDADFGTYSQSS